VLSLYGSCYHGTTTDPGYEGRDSAAHLHAPPNTQLVCISNPLCWPTSLLSNTHSMWLSLLFVPHQC
jgi:hypothetical protein